MQTWRRREPDGQKFHGGVVTIGNFDGLHLGHQKLLQTAAQAGTPSVVLTFNPHPMQVLQPDRKLHRLFPREDLQEQLPHYGVSLLWIIPFDRAFAQVTALDFLNQLVLRVFQPKHIVAGHDFAFGRGRQGTLDVLRSWSAENGITTDTVEPLVVNGQVVSSSRIRALVLNGEMREVESLLGRPFYLRGTVVAGAGRGAKIGVPTLNQNVFNETLPKAGVYLTRARCDGQTYFSVTNVGTNPTFSDGKGLKVETHIPDINVAWRGRVVDVDFLQRLRDEQKFASVIELTDQIAKDIAQARSLMESRK